jgi:PAS domain S-box-containing protein
LATWDWNVKTGNIIFNPRWAEMRGFRPEEIEPHVDSAFADVHPDDLPALQKTLDDGFEGLLPEFEATFRISAKNGDWIWLLSRGKVFGRDERGRPTRMVGTAFDITARKRAEEALRLSEAAAKQATQARDDILGVVAHDLRNPLSAIASLAQVLCAKGAERDVGDEIAVAANRMNRLIGDLLDVTRMEAGHLSLKQERLPGAEIITDALEGQRPLATSASLELRLETAPELPDIWADHDRLLQVFENLIGNAIKFTKPGGRITLGATVREGEVVFTVSDTGRASRARTCLTCSTGFGKLLEPSVEGWGSGLPSSRESSRPMAAAFGCKACRLRAARSSSPFQRQQHKRQRVTLSEQ